MALVLSETFDCWISLVADGTEPTYTDRTVAKSHERPMRTRRTAETKSQDCSGVVLDRVVCNGTTKAKQKRSTEKRMGSLSNMHVKLWSTMCSRELVDTPSTLHNLAFCFPSPSICISYDVNYCTSAVEPLLKAFYRNLFRAEINFS